MALWSCKVLGSAFCALVGRVRPNGVVGVSGDTISYGTMVMDGKTEGGAWAIVARLLV